MARRDKLLLEFAGRFRLDGDLLRCVECRTGHIVTRDSHDFIHSYDCKLRRTGGRPWTELQCILNQNDSEDSSHAQ